MWNALAIYKIDGAFIWNIQTTTVKTSKENKYTPLNAGAKLLAKQPVYYQMLYSGLGGVPQKQNSLNWKKHQGLYNLKQKINLAEHCTFRKWSSNNPKNSESELNCASARLKKRNKQLFSSVIRCSTDFNRHQFKSSNYTLQQQLKKRGK